MSCEQDLERVGVAALRALEEQEQRAHRAGERRVGAVVEQPKFVPTFSGRKNLTLLARSIGVPSAGVDAAIDRVGLTGRDRERYKGYSLGMKQRLAIAATALALAATLGACGDSGDDNEPASQQGAAKQTRAELNGADTPNAADFPAVQGRSLQDLRSLQDWYIRFGLAKAEGVAEVASVGGFEKQYQVDLDPNKLLAYGIPLNEVVNKIRMSNGDVGGKIFEVGSTEFYVRGRGYIKSVEDIENVPLKTVKGTPVYIKNVGTVHLGPDIRRGVAELDVHPPIAHHEGP